MVTLVFDTMDDEIADEIAEDLDDRKNFAAPPECRSRYDC